MATVSEIFAYFEQRVPTSMKMETDNPGFLVGNGNQTVKRILLALDITDQVIEEATEIGAELIMSHHPILFSIKNASTDDLIGRKIVAMLQNNLSAICLHTNLDAVAGGVNDALMQKLGITVDAVLDPAGVDANGQPYGLGRIGHTDEMALNDFLSTVKTNLSCNGVRYISGGRPVHKVAVCGGSGGSLLDLVAKNGCDTYVTADIKHSGFLDARAMGINLIDAGHYSTENVVIPVLRDMLSRAFPDIETTISAVHTQPEQYYL